MKTFSFLVAVALVGVCFGAEPPQRKEPTYDGKTISEWIARTKDKDPHVREDAAWILGCIRPEVEKAIPVLTSLLKDEDGWVRNAAAKSLGDLGSKTKTAVPLLIRLLKDNDVWVRRAAAETLGKIGPDAKSAIPALIESAKDRRVQEAAEKALEKIGAAITPKISTPKISKIRPDELLPRFTAKVKWIEFEGEREGTAVPIGTEFDMHWLVGLDILSIEKPGKAFEKKGEEILLIHSPVLFFRQPAEAVIGKEYSFQVFGELKEGIPRYTSAEVIEKKRPNRKQP